MEWLAKPCNILKACRLASFAGVVVNIGRDAIGIHEANVLYNALLLTIGVIAWALLHWFVSDSPGSALQAFAWAGGTTFALMIFYDAVSGNEWLHAFTLYWLGIFLLVIHTDRKPTILFTCYASAIGFIAGVFYANADYAVWTALLTFAMLTVALYIAPRLHTYDEIESIVRVCRNAERRKAARER